MSPRIPIIYTLLGNVNISNDSIVGGYGINNTLIEVNVHIDMNVKVIIPFKSDVFNIKKDVTLVSKFIQGDIPSSYLGSNSTNAVIPIR